MRSILTRRVMVASFVFLLSLVIFSAGYFQENKEAYLFPIIVAIVMLICSFISLMREFFDLCLEDYQGFPFVRQLPALAFMIAGVWLLEILGMFTTTFLILLSVSYWYSPLENNRKRLIRSLIFSGGFCIVMYLLFAVSLNVQLPRGLLY